MAGKRVGLTPKQKKFCLEYVGNGFNSKNAYAAAYPDANDNTCRVNGIKNMRVPMIQAEIERLLEEYMGSSELIAKKVLMKLSEMAFSSKEDETYTPKIALDAINLIQKQLGLQTNNVNAKVETVIFAGESELED